MVKKIQKYLILNHPLLWNMKIIPMGLTILFLNLIFFLLGFLSTKIDFHSVVYFYRSANPDNYFLKLIAVLASILVLIFWLIFYFKNNAFKSFYPKKSSSLYKEWLICFILILGNLSYCFSLSQGIKYKERSYISQSETLSALNILHSVDILLPGPDPYSFMDVIYRNRMMDEPSNNIYDTIPKEDSVSISLLNFSETQSYYAEGIPHFHVKKWLIEGKKDSIQYLMNEYLALQKKHDLKTNLTADTWMKLIYKPPNFPVIAKIYKRSNFLPSDSAKEYYVEWDKLYTSYNRIHSSHFSSDDDESSILITLYISLFISLLLFSFRVTSGKSWLTSLVVSGLLTFIYGVVMGIIAIDSLGDSYFIYITLGYWTILFIVMIIFIRNKIINYKPKGYSAVMLNLFLWMIPILPLIYYGIYMKSSYEPGLLYGDSNNPGYSTLYQLFKDNPYVFFWINIIFVIIFLYLVMKAVKKWRALPEE